MPPSNLIAYCNLIQGRDIGQPSSNIRANLTQHEGGGPCFSRESKVLGEYDEHGHRRGVKGNNIDMLCSLFCNKTTLFWKGSINNKKNTSSWINLTSGPRYSSNIYIVKRSSSFKVHEKYSVWRGCYSVFLDFDLVLMDCNLVFMDCNLVPMDYN